MRKAQDFVEEYRKKGYPDDRIRIIASMRPEPLRSEVLRVLSEITEQDAHPTEEQADTPAPPAEEKEPDVTKVEAEAVPEPPTPAPEAAKEEEEAAPVAPARAKVDDARAKREGELKKAREKAEAEQKKIEEVARKEKDKLVSAHAKELASLKKEQEKLAVDLKKRDAELQKLCAENGRAADHIKKLKSLEPLEAEVEQLRAERGELQENRNKLEARARELEGFLAQREDLLAEKDDKISTLETTLAEERAGHKAAITRTGELAATIERQAGKLQEFDGVQEQVNEFSGALESLKEEATRLKDSEQSKSGRIVELESETTRAQEEASELQEQIAANDRALEDLQEKLTSRESELESLRAHFDLEAQDLKKRAEQEVRLVQRRVQRVQKLAAMGAAIAACVTIILFIGFIHARVTSSDLRAEIVEMRQAGPRDSGVASDTRVLPPGDAVATDRSPSTDEAVSPAPQNTGNVRRGPGVLSANIGTGDETPAIGGVNTTTTETPAPGSRVIEYTVKKGDMLWNIAKEQTGDPNNWKSIARENGISGSKLKPGQKLKITIKK